VLVLANISTPANALEQSLAEDQLGELVNDARASHGLARLQLRDDLATIARERSHDMAVQQYFGHDMPDGRHFENLLDAAGIGYWQAAEIIACNNRSESSSVQAALVAWLDSVDHREIVFDERYTELGVGVWTSAGGMNYFTAFFLEHRPVSTAAGKRDPSIVLSSSARWVMGEQLATLLSDRRGWYSRR
jgi:uncharacterized protein YkwD